MDLYFLPSFRPWESAFVFCLAVLGSNRAIAANLRVNLFDILQTQNTKSYIKWKLTRNSKCDPFEESTWPFFKFGLTLGSGKIMSHCTDDYTTRNWLIESSRPFFWLWPSLRASRPSFCNHLGQPISRYHGGPTVSHQLAAWTQPKPNQDLYILPNSHGSTLLTIPSYKGQPSIRAS